MTRDDIISMAREAGGYVSEMPMGDAWLFDDAALERFAALVAAAEREQAIEIAKGMQEELEAKFEQTYMQGVIAGAAVEREACAKLCEAMNKYMDDGEECATAIRARGESK